MFSSKVIGPKCLTEEQNEIASWSQLQKGSQGTYRIGENEEPVKGLMQQGDCELQTGGTFCIKPDYKRRGLHRSLYRDRMGSGHSWKG